MYYKLVLQNHVDGLTESQWSFSPPAVVGRDPDSDICFDHDSISRKHCQFSLNGEGALAVKDLDSMNGIYVNDRRVTSATLMPHQTLQVGSVIMKVEFIEESEFRKAPAKPVVKPKGSVYATQPMPTFRPDPEPVQKPWWRRWFE